MSVAGSQQRTALHLLSQLQPHWRNDRHLPARIQALLTRNRSFGSRDRRLYRELIYTTLRYLTWVERSLSTAPEHALRVVAWLAADSRATEKFREALIADWPPCPEGLSAKAACLDTLAPAPNAGGGSHHVPAMLLPQWFREHCPEAFELNELDTLLKRAPLWLRLQSEDPSSTAAEFSQKGWRWETSSLLPSAWEVSGEVDVTTSAAFERGAIEIQDLGSQLVLESVGVEHRSRWLDACAGAGGKTLQLARMVGAEGHVDAFDIRAAALRELATRAARAQAQNVTILQQPPTGTYDGVLVDAPCTGSGTWRRAPHLKWTTSPGDVQQATRVQDELLSKFAKSVRPGGTLVYATCSLSRYENEDVVARFLLAQPGFEVAAPRNHFGASLRGGGLTFLPSRHNHDGFFVAAFRRVN